MKIYETTVMGQEGVGFAGTMADVKAAIEDRNCATYMPDVRVVEIDARMDKKGIISALNGTLLGIRLREWHGTIRGGLKEMA